MSMQNSRLRNCTLAKIKESNIVTGKKDKPRTQPGYHASRGWFYKPIQKVIKRWDSVFGREFTHETFQQLRRVMENGRGNLEIYIVNEQHRRFVCELMSAFDELHDRDNSYGWAVRIWPQLGKNPKRLLPTYSEIRDKIVELGGPTFSEDAIKQAAKRLRMLAPETERNADEIEAHTGLRPPPLKKETEGKQCPVTEP